MLPYLKGETPMNRNRYRDLMDDIEAVLGERKRMLTIDEFAALSGRNRQTVWQWCASDKLPATQTVRGGRYLINYRQLLDFFPEVAA